MLLLYPPMRRSAVPWRLRQHPVGARSRARLATRRARGANAAAVPATRASQQPPNAPATLTSTFGLALLDASNHSIALPTARIRRANQRRFDKRSKLLVSLDCTRDLPVPSADDKSPAFNPPHVARAILSRIIDWKIVGSWLHRQWLHLWR